MEEDVFSKPCGYCGLPYNEHDDQTPCAAHQWARGIIAKSMNKIFGFPDDEETEQ